MKFINLNNSLTKKTRAREESKKLFTFSFKLKFKKIKKYV